MSKSQNTNANQRHQRKLAVALIAGGLVAGCGGSDPWSIDPEGYDGIGEETFELLTNPCTISSASGGSMTLSVRGGETVYVSLRAADNNVIADGMTSTSSECAVPSTYKITITEDSSNTGVEKVFLDYINGPFSVGSTAGSVVTPGITLALGAGSSLVVRGSSGADKIYLGSTYTSNVLTASWINVNGDTSPDIRMVGVTDVKVSTGVGADIISADGANGTTGVILDSTITFSAYGGPDADTLTGGKGTTLLDGGDGDDKFIQSTTAGPDNMVGGKGVDTVDYSARTLAVNVTVCTTCSLDPGGCVTADTTCHTTADTAQGTCNTAASTAKGTCDTAANTAKGTCDTAANDARATCDTTADDDHTTCVAACPSGGGNAACVALCDTAQTDDHATCASDETAALALCTSTQTAAVAVCTATHTAAFATCDATEATCLGAAGTPLCSICRADDGTGSEGDTVNDDVEIVLGSKGNDTISATWAVCSDGATVPTVKCTLKGNEGDDTLTGSSHNDLIDGGTGNDMMQGGLGNDTFVGGAGFDTVSYADRSNAVKVSLDSTRLWTAGQNGETGENDAIPSDIENLTGGAGNDSLRGNASANIIHGGAGNDTIEGAAGNDALYGDAGNDLIYGGVGNDMLVGGAGTDTLVGGDGDDFIDSADSPAANDTAINCDGVNDSALTAGTSAGTADALVKDGSDSGAMGCEL